MSKIQELDSARRCPATGPRTEEGKRRSSLNALRHGLTGQIVVMPGEDLEAYQKHCREAHAGYAPVGFEETDLVQTIADFAWRLKRHRALENNILAIAHTNQTPNFHVTEENSDGHSAATALLTASAYQAISKDLERLSLYEQRLNRQYSKAKADLAQLQTARRTAERQAMPEAALLKSAHDEAQEQNRTQHGVSPVPFNPAAYQFVFSNAEIDAFIRRFQALAEGHRSYQLRGNAYYAAA